MDECLRAISGFKGTEDVLDDKLLDTSFISDCARTKKVSSAPSYGLESAEDTNEEPKAFESGSEQWSITLENHIPLILGHSSAMVGCVYFVAFEQLSSRYVWLYRNIYCHLICLKFVSKVMGNMRYISYAVYFILFCIPLLYTKYTHLVMNPFGP